MGLLLLAAPDLARAQPDEVVPPRPVEQPAPVWPGRGGEIHDVVVPVVLEVGADGSVRSVQVEASVAPDYDAEALRVARTWRFEPALRNGVPAPAKIRAIVRFVAARPAALPEEETDSTQHEEPGAAPAGERAAPASPAPHAGGGTDHGRAPPVAAPDQTVEVLGRSAPVSRGSSDLRIHVGQLSQVPRKNATSLLELSPGVFLQNEGGSGHSERIYLRGFDAREGQDIELSVDGVPVNDSGNPHGNGVADLHFIIPETVHALRVLEGPFDPRQGNYAVAGSADYELGLDRRGIGVKATTASFGTRRLLLTWGPPGERLATFGAADLSTSDGFGQNRDSRRATAVGQYEGALGSTGTYRLATTAYTTEYHSAGLVRQDDVDAGRIDRFGTYDTRQGGQSTRVHVAADLETRASGVLLHQQLFAIRRSQRLRENFTGFLQDPQEPTQSPHGQRGDLLDSGMAATTLGARGFARTEVTALGRPVTMEVGYFARGDGIGVERQRVLAGSSVPYRTETRVDSTLLDVGLHADVGFRPLRWVTARGGVRSDLFSFDVNDRCAAQSVSRPAPEPSVVDQSCLDQQRLGGHREPNTRTTTASTAVLPRATLLLGSFSGFTFSAAYGQGARSTDPIYVTQDVATPFARIESVEGGVTYARTRGSVALEARSTAFSTHVDRDQIFSQTAGRNVLASGTSRTGWAGSVRATGERWDQSLSLTLVRSTFDDTHLLVPYAPDVVARSDSSYRTPLPVTLDGHSFQAGASLGAGYVGRRALPFGQRSDTIFLVDGSLDLSYRSITLELGATNLFDTQYRAAEYQFASSFNPGQPPALVPARHFAAGTPRTVFLALSVTLGGEHR